MNTYETAADADADRAQQIRLLAALGAWDRALRRDELSAWCIAGIRGRIYTDGKGWVLHVACRSPRHWSAVRTKLATFATITQDGDEEGVARLHDLPAPEQTAVIREALGIRKRVAVSTKQRSRLGELAKAFGFKPKHHGEAVRAVLVVEDDPVIAMDILQGLEAAGASCIQGEDTLRCPEQGRVP